jgi:Mg2+-importing ATPase
VASAISAFTGQITNFVIITVMVLFSVTAGALPAIDV